MKADDLGVRGVLATLRKIALVIVNRFADCDRPIAEGGRAILASTGQGARIGLSLEIGQDRLLVGLLVVVGIGKTLGPPRTILHAAYEPCARCFGAPVAQPDTPADALIHGLPTRFEPQANAAAFELAPDIARHVCLSVWLFWG